MHDRLSRRRVITGLAAASVAAVAGCGSPGGENETSPEESPAEGESPTESPMGGGEETPTESPMGGGEETTESPMGGENETESPMANETESPMGNETEPGETTTANETDGGLLE
ncbi:hypothetical protein [Halorientalis salina]|uniref:hypothetical protein n=1 Tax=Halorientalis salina TaxID=2932266 RepID=UPI0010ABB67C|nr:hypothetical protein [Halorientalis salina]